VNAPVEIADGPPNAVVLKGMEVWLAFLRSQRAGVSPSPGDGPLGEIE
jgi:hypothetical protein